MNTEYTWEVKVKNVPHLKRKCNRCNCTRFYCSNKFRINAQKKNIDVWLIYRCLECDSTYNLSILSRTKPELIDKDLFEKFSRNDEEVAWKYAFSMETMQRNNIEWDNTGIEYEIVHDHISIKDLLTSDKEIIKFRIQTRFEFGLKLSSVVRTCLGLSATQFNRMAEAKIIFMPESYPLKKHKVRNGDRVWIDRERLRTFL